MRTKILIIGLVTWYGIRFMFESNTILSFAIAIVTTIWLSSGLLLCKRVKF